jgi:pimeloyl-ACP methyl ester carboxylesterase
MSSVAGGRLIRMNHVTSKDGTPIAYDRQGSGPAVILVGGGLDDGAENVPLAAELARSFTVYNYARRGRAGSGDTLPYSLEREIEDLEALIAEAGGSAHLYGVSSGGALALEAAAAGVAVDRIGVYEVPYSIGEERRWREYTEQLAAALAAGDRGGAVELFMRVAGAPEESIASARSLPVWPGLEALAHTLAYDAACLRDGRPPAAFATITQPVLVATGGGAEFFERAGDVVAASLPNAERLVMPRQSHVADPQAVVPVLERFLNG